MACLSEKVVIPFPSRIVGWLNVWDTDCDIERNTDGSQPCIPWEPSFLVLRQDLKTLTCHKQEEGADDQPSLREVPSIRLDGSKREFDKRWGYEALESIKENAIQHENHCHSLTPLIERDILHSIYLTTLLTPDRYCPQSRLIDCNESLPDLSRGFDNMDHTRRRHILFRKFFHSSYEKIVHERRGSMPLVSAGLDEENMDTTSTPSKIANFFMRKGFKTNLKRTKSVTKLDRKRSASNISESDTSIINSRIRSSRSHESLLTNSVTMHSIDLASQELDIKPLHSSILGQDHCFQVATSHGSKYISCRTAEEREKWLGSLRKTVQPNQDNVRRTDNSLKLWVKEAKNVPSKKRYFCEICLDKTLYARTSSKTKADMLFWGEHFEFNNLPPLEIVTVNLFREADKKKKKDKNCLIGYVNIPVADICNRQFVEKWYTTSSGTVGKIGKENKSELPLVRLKARFHVVDILPMELYQDFTQYLSQDYCKLCEVLEQIVSVREKEELATTMVHIMQKLEKAKDFLSDVIMAEIAQQENQNLTFRGNTIGTKAMEAYMKLVGEKYLHDTLSDFVRTIIDSEDDCEVDPTKLVNPAQLNNHQRLLDMYCEMVLAKIINSHCYFPCELREVFSSFRDQCDRTSKENFGDNLISASIFLRFLCPAILSPSLFNLTQEYPPDKAARNLTLIAKTVQTLANFSKFGGKEEFMTFMNEFLERQWGSMRSFLHQISSTEGSNQFLQFDGYIDLGKELSVLHSLLLENLEKADKESVAKLGKLPTILDSLNQALDDPEVEKRIPVKHNRKSQIYDNLVNPPQAGTSPTEVLREMLRHCGEEDIPVLSGRRGAKHGSVHGSFDGSTGGSSGRNPARHLNTNDDYVMIRALNSRNESEVSDVSVSSRSNTLETNQSWNEIVNAAEGLNGEYIDLLSYIDEDPQNSSMELEHNMNGSQMSISQISTIASSGYQSFGYSQSNSPVEPSNQQDGINRDYSSKSPSGHHSMQPLSFSNPMYRHIHSSLSSSRQSGTPTPMQQGSTSSGSLSSEEDSNTVKHRSPIKHADRGESTSSTYSNNGNADPLRNLAPKLSSSSSSESLQDHDRHRFSRSLSSPNNDPVKFSLDFHSSCPSHIFEDFNNSNVSSTTNVNNSYSLSRAPSRPHELLHTGSVDFTYMRQKYGDQMRRTATDSRISQNSTPVHTHSDSGVSVSNNRSQMSPEDSPAHRRLSPQTTVHMGIRSVQRKIHEQEKTKQEYEQEVEVLKQQVADAQRRLQNAEKMLQEQQSGTHLLVEDWQLRLEESEERMKKQQTDKDDQMKNIIQRLMTIENEQEEMEKIVHQKQRVIEAQERRIQSLDNANAKLMSALSQLKDQYSTSQPRNGMIGPLRSKLTPSEFAEFKTSSC
ncbi:disabled homolog 2-interacting protein-like isoform X4 [Pecten maximus]|uniref:disabled homolog 2-interacting protein-like isoform X4 n=1 Tax=Pecten maximus TaxID=6579 RepID=UPI001458B46D|nr:disabled homolog 2-interacting protein-like isoform X4 [Pecten maximus]